jgi:hypothetical protein
MVKSASESSFACKIAASVEPCPPADVGHDVERRKVEACHHRRVVLFGLMRHPAVERKAELRMGRHVLVRPHPVFQHEPGLTAEHRLAKPPHAAHGAGAPTYSVWVPKIQIRVVSDRKMAGG